ncbi:PBCV-specific basic adaptor domain-containing protein [Paramecium bursaria Chlorella virus NYs1]|uniref:PBCV-specific basic adaptor domain-containing protein n=1 Tax=Paramecium bursaria Chlorella virus NYs1 TaxID=83442 RepID=M1I3R7_9PHYC|nr:hypothetical protein AR158_C733L [Paramecium bursaria Chlorella virus AR158]YP_009665552.1 PBCV-specific basic adaptor domain-containing protein [Paramecium bursaria Chlorella virus NYs1]AGE54407.1 PBCV-specific basic adaptor domain-containing protein [Paramecium bursaria Chlorella virus IL-5-2s1]AGE55090.1 PBCV-specific basic adaptor domain-containing protein [Paramecium bursaria Chlorella virus MA1D]ABU44278.1 hypothetical protein AR158_C733L [Paramecium bursaria Chlorella virus AR158]AGE
MEYARSYALSPNPPGQAESHLISSSLRAKPLANIPIEEARAASKLRVKQSGTMFNPVLFGAKKIGGGAYGTAYIVRLTPTTSQILLRFMTDGGGKIVKGAPPIGKDMIIKVVKQKRSISDQEFFKDNVRENVVHRILSTSQGCIAKHVPNFYMSFIIGSPRNHESITVMDVAGDTDLNRYVKNKKIPPKMYVEIERAICCLWLAGYIHGDLHRENIMINTRTFQVKLIDFGFATKLPPNFVSVLSRKINTMISRGYPNSLGDVWTNKPIDGKMRLVNYTNRVMAGRGYPWYNPDYKILRTLFNQVPRKLRSKIPTERSNVWGIKIEQTSKPQSKLQVRPKTQPQVRPKTQPQVVRPKTQPQVRPKTQPQVRPKTQPQIRPKTQPQIRPKTQPQVRPKTQPQVRPKTQPQMPNPKIQKSSSIMTKKLSDAERVAIYARRKKMSVNASIVNLERRKTECRRRGLTYNPIIRQCVSGSSVSGSSMQMKTYKCREDCARIGKQCGPKGRCVKL